MCTVEGVEIVTSLEVSPDESTVPRDIFIHLYNVHEEAGKGSVVFSFHKDFENTTVFSIQWTCLFSKY